MFFSDFFDINAEETIRKKKCSITLNINEENGIILLFKLTKNTRDISKIMENISNIG